MGFLYSINRPELATTPRVPTNDIWLIYRQACAQADAPIGSPPPVNPPLCTTHPFVWDSTNTSVTTSGGAAKVAGFLQGANARFVNDPAAATRIVQRSVTFGVGSNTTPVP